MSTCFSEPHTLFLTVLKIAKKRIERAFATVEEVVAERRQRLLRIRDAVMYIFHPTIWRWRQDTTLQRHNKSPRSQEVESRVGGTGYLKKENGPWSCCQETGVYSWQVCYYCSCCSNPVIYSHCGRYEKWAHSTRQQQQQQRQQRQQQQSWELENVFFFFSNGKQQEEETTDAHMCLHCLITSRPVMYRSTVCVCVKTIFLLQSSFL